ncbi:MAG: LexA-related DNA-binding protein [Thermococcales archaeon 44_46]|nr:MAG: LexA-related DNA-binding protein [Thermococcales archaeon 44_46]HIH72998.1 DNA-binding protein [Thermococcaceae archaeon]
MGKLDDVLELIKSGVRTSKEIAERLDLTVDEVEGIIKILESLGYVEKVEMGSSCSSCPLKKICPGSCVVFKGSIYELKKDDHRST